MQSGKKFEIQFGSDIIAKVISDHSDRVFLYPGGTIAPIIDSLVKRNIHLYTARSEQGAGFAAIGAARVMKNPEVVLVSSGPGVTNLMTSIADAYCDSTPLVAICGQVGQQDIKTGLPIRQLGFQEVDNNHLFHSISKKVFSPNNLEELNANVQEAFFLATNGRPGPVVVNVHMNLQREIVPEELIMKDLYLEQSYLHPAESSFEKMAMVISQMKLAKKPLFILGHGALDSNAATSIRNFVKVRGIPVSHSLHALGLVNSEHDLNLGFHGHTGERISGEIIQEADFILVLGSRLDIRQTGTEFDDFGRSAYKVRVDIDQDELRHSRVKCDLSFTENLSDWFVKFEKSFPAELNWLSTNWVSNVKNRILKSRNINLSRKSELSFGRLNPYKVISSVNEVFASFEVNVVTGVGSHQQWVAREFNFDHPKSLWLTSGGLGTMGFDLPAAIGAAIARPDSETICMVGDGSLQMNIQELAFLEELNLNVKIIVFDNNKLGIVSQFQNMNWKSDPTCGQKRNPNFVEISLAYGIPADEISEVALLESKLTWLRDLSGPGLLSIKTADDIDVTPLLLAKDAIDNMWPYQKVT